MNRTKPLILSFEKQSLFEAFDGISTTILIALADISNVTEFCPVSDELPNGLSLIQLKKGQQFPVKGTPAHIKAIIDEAGSAS